MEHKVFIIDLLYCSFGIICFLTTMNSIISINNFLFCHFENPHFIELIPFCILEQYYPIYPIRLTSLSFWLHRLSYNIYKHCRSVIHAVFSNMLRYSFCRIQIHCHFHSQFCYWQCPFSITVEILHHANLRELGETLDSLF